ncbi:hypothetical protein HK102_003036 [Quaeritorhiza haematococci]|nr:hypothetical protein HK102_003036 [Quaeritorhiza haematococci]
MRRSEKGSNSTLILLNIFVCDRDGVSRRFGFIGYATEKEAQEAIRYFNSTYIDTSRITVEPAKTIGDPSLARPWSRHSKGSSAHEKKLAQENAAASSTRDPQTLEQKRKEVEREASRKEAFLAALYGGKVDEQLKEYLEVMQPRSAKRTWANDEHSINDAAQAAGKMKVKSVVSTVPNRKPGGEGLVVAKAHLKFEDSDDEYEDLPQQAAAGQQETSPATTTSDSAEPDSKTESSDVDAMEEDSVKGSINTIAADTTISDMDYFKSKMKRGLDEDDEESEPVEDSLDASVHPARRALVLGQPVTDELVSQVVTTPRAQQQIESMTVASASKPTASDDNPEPPNPKSDVEMIADTGRLLVRNLTYTCTTEDLTQFFEPFGPLSEVHIPLDKETKKSKGFAFVLFLIPEHAINAFVALDGTIFQGRILQILAAEEKRVRKEENVPGTFKDKREQKRKSEANKEFTWNSLFMNSDSVISSMANKLGVAKSEILDPESENMAVRVALAETQIINETKSYLEEHGVKVESFETQKQRSQTTILVKNIPFNTEEEEVQGMFEKFGTLSRVILPPTRTIALVEFSEPSEAKTAFRNLAYTRFKNLPLYLEWAPEDTFISGPPKATKQSENSEEDADSSSPKQPSSSTLALHDGEDDEATSGAVASLFVKNLSFETTEDKLRSAFAGVGGLRTVRIVTKPDAKTGMRLSMGFGFLEFGSKDSAMRALKSMQGFKLDGHALQLKFSNAAAKSSGTSANGAGSKKTAATKREPGTKLVVRNVPFEATKKDLKQLFSPFGQVKAIRLPRKIDGNHRGFAFVDFVTKQEAKSAYDTLHATHLYGRHLVMEWAEDVEDVESIRDKTRKTFAESQPNKRRRVMEEGADEE